MAEPARPGRSCPLGYVYGAAALRAAPVLHTETLYVVGGLYGNPYALDAVLAAFDEEPGERALLFNGDFHWFDHDAADFLRINRAVLAHRATRGNVETELALPSAAAGCGCGYPQWVADAEVARSNRILERLRDTGRGLPAELAPLAALSMFAVARIGGVRVGIVHGDADSLAGWAFSQERLDTAAGAAAARDAFAASAVRVFASSHTCLPVLQSLDTALGDCAIVNNGAAGMANFSGTRHGIVTRISLRPPRAARAYGARIAGLHVDALPLHFDSHAWREHFLERWPAGSDAHASYFSRITDGPRYEAHQALRLNQPSYADAAG